MMSAITAEKVAAVVPDKKDEKLVGKKDDKRRALGRGLESLLPGPRAVVSPESRAPSGEGSGPGQRSSDVGETELSAPNAPIPSTPIPPTLDERPGEVISIQAQPAGHQTGRQTVTDLGIELIDKNPYQTRYVFKEETLKELADSIMENGIVQPVVVRPSEEPGRYFLVLGERRLRASKMAGLKTIPAIVRRLSLQQAAEMTVLENVQRQDLNPLEQAEAFRVLSKQFNLTQAQIAERIGVSRETVANYMRLLRLPEDVMKYMLDGRLSFSDARAILALDQEEHMRVVANEVVTRHLKWNEIEARVRELNGFVTMQKSEGGDTGRGGARWIDPNVRAAQRDMEQVLGMRVVIKDKNGKGRIMIDYTSVDEYDRVVELLRGKK